MPSVRCKLCANFENGFCTVKSNGGKDPKVHPNKLRSCNKYIIDPEALAREADKEYEKRAIPRYAPTWRYYADSKDLKELGEQDGPRYVRTNPNVR